MSKDNEKLEKEGEDNDWSLEQGFWTTAYWINFILCSVSFFLSTAFSLLSKIPVLGFFCKTIRGFIWHNCQPFMDSTNQM